MKKKAKASLYNKPEIDLPKPSEMPKANFLSLLAAVLKTKADISDSDAVDAAYSLWKCAWHKSKTIPEDLAYERHMLDIVINSNEKAGLFKIADLTLEEFYKKVIKLRTKSDNQNKFKSFLDENRKIYPEPTATFDTLSKNGFESEEAFVELSDNFHRWRKSRTSSVRSAAAKSSRSK
jgi:hypothetical protein